MKTLKPCADYLTAHRMTFSESAMICENQKAVLRDCFFGAGNVTRTRDLGMQLRGDIIIVMIFYKIRFPKLTYNNF